MFGAWDLFGLDLDLERYFEYIIPPQCSSLPVMTSVIYVIIVVFIELVLLISVFSLSFHCLTL